jgi:outer membrane immunogenic protein
MNLSKAKNYLLTGTAGIAVAPMLGMAGASVANAADMAVKAPPPAPVAAPSWAGWYIGVNVGGAGQRSYFFDPDIQNGVATPGTRNGSSFIGGGQIGYNWQSGNFVYGLEGDFSGLSRPTGTYFRNTRFGSPNCCTYGSHVPWLATVRGRLGVTVGDGNTLLYGTGGVAIGRVKAMANEAGQFGPGSPLNDYSATRVGWAAGGGIERMIAPHWTVGLEGLFADLGSYTKASSAEGKCCATVHNKLLIGRFKINYKF